MLGLLSSDPKCEITKSKSNKKKRGKQQKGSKNREVNEKDRNFILMEYHIGCSSEKPIFKVKSLLNVSFA